MKRALHVLALAIAVTGALFSQGAPAVEPAIALPVDELEADLIGRLNVLRSERGLDPLRVSRGLSAAAREHSVDLARHRSCRHTSANGAPFWRRLSRFYGRGATWRYWAVAENILCHPRPVNAAAALREWMGSTGHRANLLSSQWRDVGVAAVYRRRVADDAAGEVTFVVTADFGVRR